MIVFDLQCLDGGETFEAWFRSGADVALAVDHEPAVGDLGPVDEHGKRADMQPDAMLLRRFTARCQHFVFIFGPQALRRSSGITIEQTGHLGREQHLSAALGSFPNRI